MRQEIRRLEFSDFTLRECLYSAGTHLPRHVHDYSNVTVVLGGEIEEVAPGGTYRGRSCSVVLKPAGIEHENRVGGLGARTLTIETKDGAISETMARRSWSWFDGPEIVRAGLALHRANGRDLEDCAFDLLAAVICAPGRECSEPEWLPAVKSMLGERFGDAIRFDSIAREIGLHPVYLSRAFRRHTGVAMRDYVRALRLREARHLLSASKRNLTTIASDCGFTDGSHLSRTFAALLGVTPKVYRQLFGEVQRVQVSTQKHA
jgi:AraC family transcriptional regulator